MKLNSLSEVTILHFLNISWDKMSLQQRKLWDVVKIPPSKWAQHPYGDTTEGFWAVGVYGNVVIWYNEIEEGFNRSTYSKFGVIDHYWCNQDELGQTIQHVLNEIEYGYPSGEFAAPPEPNT